MTIFLDRDGTVIVDKNYLKDPDEVELIPGVGEALRKLVEWGHKLVIVTNQSGIARGFFQVADMNAVQARLEELLAEYGVAFDGVYHCPHAPEDGCDCRKPKIGMALSAQRDLGLDLSDACMVGDMDTDMEFGRTFGAKLCVRSVDELLRAFDTGRIQ